MKSTASVPATKRRTRWRLARLCRLPSCQRRQPLAPQRVDLCEPGSGSDENLSGGVALRHERYSDFGSTTSAKGSARYAFDVTLSLRVVPCRAVFRAPSLAQQYYTITTTNFQVVNGVNTPIETGTFAVNTPQAHALGAQDLKPEKARNYSLGLQFQP